MLTSWRFYISSELTGVGRDICVVTFPSAQRLQRPESPGEGDVSRMCCRDIRVLDDVGATLYHQCVQTGAYYVDAVSEHVVLLTESRAGG